MEYLLCIAAFNFFHQYLIVFWVEIFLFLLLCSYSCPDFPLPHFTLPCPTHPHLPCSILLPSCWLCPWIRYTCSLMDYPLLCPIIWLPPPLWFLSVCFLFQCVCFYFAHFFVLLIMFYL